MGLYDNYELANSKLVKQYQGRPVTAAITNVSRELQGRYDYSREHFDVLGSAIDNSKIADADKAMFGQTMQTYRDQIGQAAKSGKYEDMVYNINKMGRDFAASYQPFAENLQRIQGHIKNIDDRQEKGEITATTADQLKKEAAMYTGMTKGKDGKFKDFFSGRNFVKDIDKAKWVEDHAKDVAAQEGGHDGRFINGEFYIEKDNKWKIVSKDRLHTAITNAIKLDPQMNDYLKQTSELSTLGADKIKAEDLPASLRTKMQAEADKAGISIGQYYRQAKQEQIIDKNIKDMYNFSDKYAVNNKFTANKIMGETEEAGRKKTDNETTFGVPIVIPKTGNEFNSPDKLTDGLIESNKTERHIADQYSAWINTHKVSKVGDRYVLPNGQDVTNSALKFRMMTQQEKLKQAQLTKLDNEAKSLSHFKPTPQLQQQAKKAQEDYNNYLTVPDHLKGTLQGAIQEQFKKLGMNITNTVYGKNAVYDAVMGKASPNYKKYKEILSEKAKDMSMETVATRFSSKADNSAVETLVNNMTTNDFESSMINAEHVGSKNGGKPFDKDEYEGLKGNIKFAGQAMDDKGQQIYIFKAEDPKTHDVTQFQMKGLVSSKSLPKLIGADASQFYSQQFLRSASSNALHELEVPLEKGVSVKVKVPDGANGKYILYLNGAGGKGGKQWEFETEDEITSKLSTLFQLNGGNR